MEQHAIESGAGLRSGVPAPWFKAREIGGSADYAFHSVAGRHVLLLFFGSAQIPACGEALELVAEARALFDDRRACFFGVSVDPADESSRRIARSLPGIRFFADHDQAVSRLYGALSGAEGGRARYRPHWVLLDPGLRVLRSFSLTEGAAALAALEQEVSAAASVQPDWAPVLLVPNVFDSATCRRLIDYYEADGGEESGFMREVDGKTVLVTDPQHKQRRDCLVTAPELKRALMADVSSKLLPMIRRAFQFEATRMERYLIGCYAAGKGHFRPHRDNTTLGTAHRRFAVTINLNAGEYDGGGLRFPEYGERTYVAPTGGAIVFSCSLLHEARPVTRGTRYAFLPFLYDEAAAQERERNNRHLGPEVAPYKA